MAEKYNLPGPGTRPLFFRLPGGGGSRDQLSPEGHTPQPAAVLIVHARGPVSVIGGHWSRIIRIVIENPTNHPISKQSVIYLVRIICIERTSAKSASLWPL